MKISNIVNLVSEANLGRHHGNLSRRILKNVEELGEVSEAYLNVTSARNSKGKTWDDVREELADSVIVALDCALTPMPDQLALTPEELIEVLESWVTKKLGKWARAIDTGKIVGDDV